MKISIIRIGNRDCLSVIPLIFSFQFSFLESMFSISSSSSFKLYFDPLSHSRDFLASSNLPFLAYQIGDSGRSIVATIRKMQEGNAATCIKTLYGKTAAQNREIPTKHAPFKMFMIESIPLNLIKDISLKYIFVVDTFIPIPEPIKHLPISSKLEKNC